MTQLSDPGIAAPRAVQAQQAAQAPAPRPRKERDPYFDNAKFLAILLVVVGHSLVGLRDVPLAGAAYLTIYLFHMPLFILVTGYLSRNFTFGSGKARKLVLQLAVPYLLFEFLYSMYNWAVGGNELSLSLLDPYYLTWFLLALFWWRLSTPVWQQIRWPLAVAVGISLLSYLDDLGDELELHRTLGLLPFYVLGLLLRREHFALLHRPVARVLGALTLAGALAVAFVAHRHMAVDWVYWKHPHSEFGVDHLTGTAMRLAMMVVAVVLIAAFLSLVPRRRTWFTGLGAATLYAYLLHGFGTRLMTYSGFDDLEMWHSVPGVLAMAAIALAVGTLLCTPPVVRTFRWLVEPDAGRMFTGLRRPADSRNVPAGKGN
ncbi:acyltransferase family protein [Thermomonospora cellulosilytica]|uniref:Fucose 4-O-acetylase-like acetyltransferase n=1 Tax=Thermomonospora cellulosilytica TaxID=1411118 RepID=A0A7W3N5H1_9ACTN|nr:acyltransferase family protein [Thermomonospora cellulosilytica]MBA9007946.1 fucose 4-O-acetylase-like acetyltransferase [Thermomonospora cellulosilytica]